MEQDHKICTKCKQNKVFSDFHKVKGKLVSRCKQCVVAINKERKLSKESGTYVDKYSQQYRQNKFMTEAVLKWGESFSYTNTVVGAVLSEIEVYCNKHLISFKTSQRVHLENKSGGCPHCQHDLMSSHRKKSNETFVKECKDLYKDLYCYNESNYTGWYENVIVFCNKHSHYFSVMAGSHLSGQGCPLCSKERHSEKKSSSQEHFEKLLYLAHGTRYDASEAKYVKNNQKVKMRCDLHGYFFIRPSDLCAGSGCKLCGNKTASEKRMYTTSQWVDLAILVHGDKYDYSQSVYNGKRVNIQIKCNTCNNVFSQNPSNHLNGAGCSCQIKNGYNTKKAGSIYVLAYENITKIGITNRKIDKRVKDINTSSGKNFKIIYHRKYEDGSIADAVESAMLLVMKDTYEGVSEKFDGYTECFLNVDREDTIKSVELIGDYLYRRNNDNN